MTPPRATSPLSGAGQRDAGCRFRMTAATSVRMLRCHCTRSCVRGRRQAHSIRHASQWIKLVAAAGWIGLDFAACYRCSLIDQIRGGNGRLDELTRATGIDRRPARFGQNRICCARPPAVLERLHRFDATERGSVATGNSHSLRCQRPYPVAGRHLNQPDSIRSSLHRSQCHAKAAQTIRKRVVRAVARQPRWTGNAIACSSQQTATTRPTRHLEHPRHHRDVIKRRPDA